MIEGFVLGFLVGFGIWAAVVRLALVFGVIHYRMPQQNLGDVTSPADRRKLVNRPWERP